MKLRRSHPQEKIWSDSLGAAAYPLALLALIAGLWLIAYLHHAGGEPSSCVDSTASSCSAPADPDGQPQP